MKKISLLLLIVPLLSTCEVEVDDRCWECQWAIDEMVEKLGLNACDPYNVVDVWDNIVANCENMDKIYIGFLAETCELGVGQNLRCDDPKSISFKNLSFSYYTATGLPEPVEVTVQYSNDSDDFFARGSDNFVFYDTDHNIATGPYFKSRTYPYRLTEGDEIKVTLYKVGTDDVLATADIPFSFERTQFTWPYEREILISYFEDLGHTIEFAAWLANE